MQIAQPPEPIQQFLSQGTAECPQLTANQTLPNENSNENNHSEGSYPQCRAGNPKRNLFGHLPALLTKRSVTFRGYVI